MPQQPRPHDVFAVTLEKIRKKNRNTSSASRKTGAAISGAECEFVECFTPAHDALSFDEACGLVAALAGSLRRARIRGPTCLDGVEDGQPTAA
jgi:hypothetical protein